MKAIIDEKFKEHTESVPKEEQKTRFVFSTGLTKELFDAEMDEVKKEVEAFRKKLGSSTIKLEDEGAEDKAMDEAEQQERNLQMQS